MTDLKSSAELMLNPKLPPSGTVKIPAAWQEFLGEFLGTVEFRRPFNWPNVLDKDERVDLVIDGLDGAGRVQLNGVLLGRMADSVHWDRFDITNLLRPHNELRIEVARKTAAGQPWENICLEIKNPQKS